VLEGEGRGGGTILPVETGERIGPYRVLRELGRGGQALVYLAEDERLGRRVALKVLKQALDPEGRQLRRFRRESEITARLDHPGICTVFEAGDHGGIPFIAMRLVDGETLARGIEAARGAPDGPHRAAVLAALFETVARTLHVAHEAGLVHRDIKPGNVMVTPGGDPVLMDFGLARDESGDSSVTMTGGVMGTPAYVAPEMIDARRGPVDRRTDVYSLGVSMYEALTGRLPFEAPTRHELYHRILATEPEDPRSLRRDLPADLAVVVLTAMAKEPDRRYQTALDLAEDLRRARTHEPIRARPAGPLLRAERWARRNPALAATLGALFLALGAGLGTSLHLLGTARDALGLATTEGEARDRALRASRDAQRETTAALEERERALRRAVALDLVGASALAEAEDPMRSLILARIAARTHPSPETFRRLRDAIRASPERPLAAREGGPWSCAVFSPEGDRVYAIATGGDLVAWDLEGRPVAPAPGDARAGPGPDRADAGGTTATFRPDGTVLVEGGGGGPGVILPAGGEKISRVAVAPGGRRILTGSEEGVVRLWDGGGRPVSRLGDLGGPVRWIAFSPDGGRAVALAGAGPPRMWDLERREAAAMRAGPGSILRLAFSADGSSLHAVTVDGRRRTFDLEGRLLEEWSAGSRLVSVSPAADRFLCRGPGGDVVLLGPGSAERTSLGGAERFTCQAEFSDRGDRIVGVGDDGAARIWDGAGRLLSALRDPDGPIRHAAIAPVGDVVATIGASRALRLLPAAGGPPRLVGDNEFNADWAGFSPDGSVLVTGGRDDPSFRVWDLAAAPPACTWIQDRLLGPPSFAPDGGRFVATVAGRLGRIWDRRGGEVADLRGPRFGRAPPAFSPDGRWIVSGSEGETGILWDRLARVEGVLAGLEGWAVAFAFSPDGRLVAGGSTDGEVRVWAAGREGLLDLAAARTTRSLTPAERERYADLLPEEEALELVAQRLIEESLRHVAVLADAPAWIAGDATLDPTVREAALRRLRGLRDDPAALNDEAWVAVVREGNRPERYVRALRQAELAEQLSPGVVSYANTRGVALFRCGRFAEAVETLSRSAAAHSADPGGPCIGDVAFLAMACRRLGRAEEARRHLDRIRRIVEGAGGPLSYYDDWFLGEVERCFGVRIERPAAK
jgi:eukaryotic-like serine/threonine-protein kinase